MGCILCSPFSASSEEHDRALSVRGTSPSQSMGLLRETNPRASLSDTYHVPHIHSLGTKKGSVHVEVQRCGNEGLLSLKEDDYLEKKPDGEKSKTVEEVEECPTCLEGYETENPKIITNCGHHFHLGCILEWMERSNNCPVCDKEMVYSEIP